MRQCGKALFLFAFNFLIPVAPAHSREKPDIKTLVIVSHPYPERSVLIKGLQKSAESLEGVTVNNLEILYGYDTRQINGDAEQEGFLSTVMSFLSSRHTGSTLRR